MSLFLLVHPSTSKPVHLSLHLLALPGALAWPLTGLENLWYYWRSPGLFPQTRPRSGYRPALLSPWLQVLA